MQQYTIEELKKMDGEELIDLLEEIIANDNYGEADLNNKDSDTINYRMVRIELHNRITNYDYHK